MSSPSFALLAAGVFSCIACDTTSSSPTIPNTCKIRIVPGEELPGVQVYLVAQEGDRLLPNLPVTIYASPPEVTVVARLEGREVFAERIGCMTGDVRVIEVNVKSEK
jgi:hypothetical protein